MRPRWSTGNTCKRSSTDGGTTPTAQLKRSLKLKFSKRCVTILLLERLRSAESGTPQLPELEPPEEEATETFKLPETEKISPPVLQLTEVTFGYTPDKILLKGVNIDVGLDSRIAVIGPNGAGKSTLYVPRLSLSSSSQLT